MSTQYERMDNELSTKDDQIAALRAENDALRRAYVRPDDIRTQLENVQLETKALRARLAEAEGELNTARSARHASQMLNYEQIVKQGEHLATAKRERDMLKREQPTLEKLNSAREIAEQICKDHSWSLVYANEITFKIAKYVSQLERERDEARAKLAKLIARPKHEDSGWNGPWEELEEYEQEATP